MKLNFSLLTIFTVTLSFCACDGPVSPDPAPEKVSISLQEMASILSSLPLDAGNLQEVHDAVTASSSNGYDEEYMMSSLFESPGSGVGDEPSSTRAERYETPLRELIRSRLEESVKTRSGDDHPMTADECINAISSSSMQIYWPYSDSWDGIQYPVITFDPCSESPVNIGYELFDDNGALSVRETMVDEEMAAKRPVWIINDNDDCAYTSLEKLRRENPDWGKGGRVIIKTKTGEDESENNIKTLILKDFTMKRHYDSWFRGASEFFVKCGSVQGFTASTEAELKLYQPSVTDFMIVVKRKNLGVTLPFDAVLISEWTDQLDSFAFLVVEDDGGTKTSWKVEATVKILSKSYGITLDIPYNEHDDIVWRGSLTSRYFEKYNGEAVHFGDVDITFEVI